MNSTMGFHSKLPSRDLRRFVDDGLELAVGEVAVEDHLADHLGVGRLARHAGAQDPPIRHGQAHLRGDCLDGLG